VQYKQVQTKDKQTVLLIFNCYKVEFQIHKNLTDAPWNILEVLRITLHAFIILLMRSFWVSTGIVFTKHLTCPFKKTSRNINSTNVQSLTIL